MFHEDYSHKYESITLDYVQLRTFFLECLVFLRKVFYGNYEWFSASMTVIAPDLCFESPPRTIIVTMINGNIIRPMQPNTLQKSVAINGRLHYGMIYG